MPSSTWYKLQPNSISKFEKELTSVTRSPIDRNRQRVLGGITDLNSGIDFEHDLTMSLLWDFIEGFTFATAWGSEWRMAGYTANPATDQFGLHDIFTPDMVTAMTIPAIMKDQHQVTPLWRSSGWANAANNFAFKWTDVDPVAGQNYVSVPSGTVLVSESNTVDNNPIIEWVGLRILAANYTNHFPIVVTKDTFNGAPP
jgi:hypothetical protein